jgi:integrase
MSYILKRGRTWYINFPYNGKEYRYSLKTKNKSRAEDLQKRVDFQLDLGSFPDLDYMIYDSGTATNVFEYLKLIKDDISNNQSKSESWRKRQTIYLDHFTQFLSEQRIKFLHKIQISTMQNYRNWRLKTKSTKTGDLMSPKTVKDELIFFKNKVFDRAIEEKLISDNPAIRALKDTKVYRAEPRPFTEAEIQLIIDNAPNEFHRDFYMALCYTGARFGEITHLEWQHIDFENKTIHIEDRPAYRTKTRKSRIIPIHPKLLTTLKHRSEQKDSTFVFPSPVDKSKPIRTLNRGFNKLKERLNIAGEKTLHSFRHSFASHLAERGVPDSVIQQMMGHSRVSMTHQYQKIDTGAMLEALSKL